MACASVGAGRGTVPGAAGGRGAASVVGPRSRGRPARCVTLAFSGDLAWAERRGGAEAESFIALSADPNPATPGVTGGVATVGTCPLPGRRVVGGGPLCLPVHVSAQLVWSDPELGDAASDGVGGAVEMCAT